MTGRIKILSVTERLAFGGDEIRLLNFARTVDRTRYDHLVAVLEADSPGDGSEGDLIPAYVEAGVRVVRLGVDPRSFLSGGERRNFRIGNVRRSLSTVRRLSQVIRRERPQVLDLRKHYAIGFGALAGRMTGVPVIAGTEYYANRLESPLRKLAGQEVFQQLDVLIGDAQASLDAYERAFPVLRGKTRVIPNGIRQPAPSRSRAEMLKLFGLEGRDGPVLGQISVMAPFKGQQVLIEAARRIAATHPQVSLALCGQPRDPAFEMELRRQIAEAGLGAVVGLHHYEGPSDDFWAAVDVHAHASLMDSSPIAIHESMAMGLPAVVTAVGGVPELVADGRSGLVVPPGDPDALAKALIGLIESPALRERLGAAARARYLERHTPEAMTAHTCALFEELLEARVRQAEHPRAAETVA